MNGNIHTIYTGEELRNMHLNRFTGHSVREMKMSLEMIYGPFPLLFDAPQRPNVGHQGAGIVITGLGHMAGGEERAQRGDPFIGAAAFGYVPAMGHTGQTVMSLFVVRGVRWDELMKPTEDQSLAIDPQVGSAPGEIARTAERS